MFRICACRIGWKGELLIQTALWRLQSLGMALLAGGATED
jgi:hypothetical protein